VAEPPKKKKKKKDKKAEAPAEEVEEEEAAVVKTEEVSLGYASFQNKSSISCLLHSLLPLFRNYYFSV